MTLQKYGLQLAPPLPFYDEAHRPSHFLTFAGMGGGSSDAAAAPGAGAAASAGGRKGAAGGPPGGGGGADQDLGGVDRDDVFR